MAVFHIDDQGEIERASSAFGTGGSAVVPGAGCPAPALGWLSPDQRFVLVPDLGMDAVVTYRVDGANHRLLPSHRNSMVPGGGPRHMKWHPNGKWATMLNELSLSLTLVIITPMKDGFWPGKLSIPFLRKP